MIIIIVLKPNFEFDPRQDLSHWSGGLTCIDLIFFKIKTTLFWVFFFYKKVNGFFAHVLSQGDPSFLSGRAEPILLLFFSWTRTSPILKSA